MGGACAGCVVRQPRMNKARNVDAAIVFIGVQWSSVR
jgi:hypothetical protein